MEEIRRDPGDGIDCGQERGFIRLRRFVKTADFSHELQRSGLNLFGRDRRVEIEQEFDVAAHSPQPIKFPGAL